MTAKQRAALALLRQARQECPTTDDGVMTAEETYYDVEVSVARVHWRTADALKDLGLVEYGDWDPDWGMELRLTEQGLAA